MGWNGHFGHPKQGERLCFSSLFCFCNSKPIIIILLIIINKNTIKTELHRKYQSISFFSVAGVKDDDDHHHHDDPNRTRAHFKETGLPRKGFSVPVQVAVDRSQPGPVLAPSDSGDGGVQVRITSSVMGISTTEVNLRRLLSAAPRQQNQAKLVHYVATLREQLEQLAEERTAEGLPRVSKAMVSDYSEKIEAIASTLASTVPDIQDPRESIESVSVKESSSGVEEESRISPSPGLRRRSVIASNTEEKSYETADANSSARVKLDAAAHEHIEKHRKLQEDLTDEMVVLARQLKESSLMVNRSVQNTEKILDSTEEAIERSLASTGHANTRASDIYSKSSATTCFTWLAIFVMTCIFIMVVLLIRVT